MKSTITCCRILAIILLIGLFLPAKADTVSNFQVYLRNEIVLRESDYRPEVSSLKFLTLGPANAHDTIFVNYSHCTAGASARKIVIWNGEDILFSRSYPDKEVAALMAIPVKDIANLYNRLANNSPVVIRYYDDQVPPDGVILANMRHDNSLPPQAAKQGQSPMQEPVKQQQEQPVLEWAVAALMTLVLLFLVFRKMTRKPA